MKRFFCTCGAAVGFEHTVCTQCGRRLAFDPHAGVMRTLQQHDGRWVCDDPEVNLELCSNGTDFEVCNWLADPAGDSGLCLACQFNRTVPNQQLPGNQQRWRILEQAKKRLFVTLLQLDLPLVNGWQHSQNGLLFDFVEDQRSQPAFYPETFVSTGYAGGVITINALEADDVQRMAARRAMNEPYRTVLGHMRHESGHYYWGLLEHSPALLASVIDVFGDPSTDYRQALDLHYEQGAAANWPDDYISAYASAHPLEDWAETWGHYLHIFDALDTAHAYGVLRANPDDMPMSERITQWCNISVVLNELNRSIGLEDAYPFYISPQVQTKLEWVDEVVVALAESA